MAARMDRVAVVAPALRSKTTMLKIVFRRARVGGRQLAAAVGSEVSMRCRPTIEFRLRRKGRRTSPRLNQVDLAEFLSHPHRSINNENQREWNG